MNDFETLPKWLKQLKPAPPREYPALGDADRIPVARNLADLRKARIVEERDLRKKTEAAWAAADAAIKAARRKLSDVEDVELVAAQTFTATEASLRIALRRGRPDCIAQFVERLAEEDVKTREEAIRNGVGRVNQTERILEDHRLSTRRRRLADAVELVEAFAELPESEAQLRARFDALVSGLEPLKVVAVIEPTRITAPPAPDPAAQAESWARLWGTKPRTNWSN